MKTETYKSNGTTQHDTIGEDTMLWRFRHIGEHVHVQVHINGALCGRLSFSKEEFYERIYPAYSNIKFIAEEMDMQGDPGTIGSAPEAYGSLVGLSVGGAETDTRGRYVTFSYEGQKTVWRVPDHALFKLLAEHFLDESFARDRNTTLGDLWIERVKGKWVMTAPNL